MEIVKEKEIVAKKALTDQELSRYMLLLDQMMETKLEIQELEAKMKSLAVEHNKFNFMQQKFIREMSLKYATPLYEPKWDIDVLTGEIKPVEISKEN